MFLRYSKELTDQEIQQSGIRGIICSINQGNAEYFREAIMKMPFYLTIIGDVGNLAKHEIEELVYFCKLDGIIVNAESSIGKLNDCVIIINNSSDGQYDYLFQRESRWFVDKEKPLDNDFYCKIK